MYENVTRVISHYDVFLSSIPKVYKISTLRTKHSPSEQACPKKQPSYLIHTTVTETKHYTSPMLKKINAPDTQLFFLHKIKTLGMLLPANNMLVEVLIPYNDTSFEGLCALEHCHTTSVHLKNAGIKDRMCTQTARGRAREECATREPDEITALH